jgi:hypothetical protein
MEIIAYRPPEGNEVVNRRTRKEDEQEEIVRCENENCKNLLSADHVSVVTTQHVRRFCSMECVVESFQLHMDKLIKTGIVEAEA